jgi:glycosyltransferase involved in cell wall biosynthesis
MRAMKITFVIPVFNEESTLETLADGIAAHAGESPWRILFVDDGSTDASWEVIARLRASDPRIGAIRLRRNYGKTLALAAAFETVKSDVIIMMDADLQDDPAEIPRMLTALEAGADLVCGWKQNRRDPWHKTVPSRIYNRVVAWLFGLGLHDVNTGFKAMRGEIAPRLPRYGDMHRMIAVFADAMGYKVAEIPVQHHPRRAGKSKYGFSRFFRGAFDVMTAWFLTRHGSAPMQVFGLTGIAASGAGLAGAIAGLIAVPVCAAAFPAATALILLVAWFGLCMGLCAWGSLAFMAGLLGGLIVHQRPPVNTADLIAEKHVGNEKGA